MSGRRSRATKSTCEPAKFKQIEVLRRMGLPFLVNACGKSVVPVTAIEGRRELALELELQDLPAQGQVHA